MQAIPVILSIILVICGFYTIKTLFFMNRFPQEYAMLMGLAVIIDRLVEQEKLTYKEADAIFDEFDLDKMLINEWAYLLLPWTWTARSHFRKGMYNKLEIKLKELQSL